MDKSLFIILIWLLAGFNAFTQINELTKLPFDIVLGETSSEQIAKFGQCEGYEKSEDDSKQKCVLYRINEGFLVKVSAQDKVTSLSLGVRYLPQNWKGIGFISELTDEEFTSLIRTFNAKNISTIKTGDTSKEIDFLIAEYKYTASFSNNQFNELKVSISY